MSAAAPAWAEALALRARRRMLAHHARNADKADQRAAAQQLLDELDGAPPPCPLPDATRGSADA